MNNQNNWKKELIYSITFFTVANLVFFLEPIYQIFSIETAFYVTMVVTFVLLFLSIYKGYQSSRKASVGAESKMFGIVGKNFRSFSGLIITFIAVLEVTEFVVAILFYR